MKHTRIFLLLSGIIALEVTSHAQDLSLKGRSAFEVDLGLWGGANAENTMTPSGIRSVAKVTGLAGTLVFSHWLEEHLCLTISAGLLSAEASSTIGTLGVSQQVSSVVPVLAGVKYYVLTSLPENAFRPFLSASIGGYVGREARNTILSQEAHSETALGGRIGGGIDILLTRFLKLGLSLNYNLVSDFKTPVGARKNYSVADVSMGLGYVF